MYKPRSTPATSTENACWRQETNAVGLSPVVKDAGQPSSANRHKKKRNGFCCQLRCKDYDVPTYPRRAVSLQRWAQWTLPPPPPSPPPHPLPLYTTTSNTPTIPANQPLHTHHPHHHHHPTITTPTTQHLYHRQHHRTPIPQQSPHHYQLRSKIYVPSRPKSPKQEPPSALAVASRQQS